MLKNLTNIIGTFQETIQNPTTIPETTTTLSSTAIKNLKIQIKKHDNLNNMLNFPVLIFFHTCLFMIIKIDLLYPIDKRGCRKCKA